MMLLIIVCAVVISMMLGALFYIVKQPLNPRKSFQNSMYSGLAFTALIRLIATTNKVNSSILVLAAAAVGVVICFFLGWSFIGIRKEKKESA
jgi:chromate transport protein ChrA